MGEESSPILIASSPLTVFVREYLFMYIITRLYFLLINSVTENLIGLIKNTNKPLKCPFKVVDSEHLISKDDTKDGFIYPHAKYFLLYKIL